MQKYKRNSWSEMIRDAFEVDISFIINWTFKNVLNQDDAPWVITMTPFSINFHKNSLGLTISEASTSTSSLLTPPTSFNKHSPTSPFPPHPSTALITCSKTTHKWSPSSLFSQNPSPLYKTLSPKNQYRCKLKSLSQSLRLERQPLRA